jgi:hypothetical protein
MNVANLVLLTAADVVEDLVDPTPDKVIVAGTLVIDAGTGVGVDLVGPGIAPLHTSAATIVGIVRESGAVQPNDTHTGGFLVLNDGALSVDQAPAGALVAGGDPVLALQGVQTTDGPVFIGTKAGSLNVLQDVRANGAASDLGLSAGTGGILALNANVSAGRNAAFVAAAGITQTDGMVVDAVRASFDAGTGSVGTIPDPLDLRVGTVAAKASGDVVLHKADEGKLVIGTVPIVLGLPEVSGIKSNGATIVSTTSGDLSVESSVSAASVLLTANGGDMSILASTSASGAVQLTADGDAALDAPISGASVTATANGGMGLTSSVSATGSATYTAAAINVSQTGSVSAGSASLSAGSINLAGDIMTSGTTTLAAGVIDITADGSIQAGTALVQATGSLNVNGLVKASGIASLSGTPVTIAAMGFVLGKTVVVNANSGLLLVTGRVEATDTATLSGSAITVAASGVVAQTAKVIGASVTMTATAGDLTVGGRVQAAGNATLSGQDFLVMTNLPNGVIPAGGIVSVDGTVTIVAEKVEIQAKGTIAAGSATIQATKAAAAGGFALTVAGTLQTAANATLLAPTVTINSGSIIKSGSLNATASLGDLIVAGQVQSAGKATFNAASISFGNTSVVTTGSLDATASGGMTIAGRLHSAGKATLSAANVSFSYGSVVTTGSLDVTSKAGPVLLNGAVSAVDQALITAQTSISQGPAMTPNGQILVGSLTAAQAGLTARTGIGADGAPILLHVGTIAAQADAGSVFLTQQGGAGITVGNVAGLRGITASNDVSLNALFGSIVIAAPAKANGGKIDLRTDRGDIVLGDLVFGQTISVSAGQPVGAPEAKVLFNGGYLETPKARVVGDLAPPQPLPNPIRLNTSFSLSFLATAGSQLVTSGGVLVSDRGLSVHVDFIPRDSKFFATMGAHPTLTDTTGLWVASGSGFGPFSFTYTDEFLFEQSLKAGSREQLFDIVITATQDASIFAETRTGNVTREVITKSEIGTQLSSQPPVQSQAALPVILQVRLTPQFQFPIAPSREPIFNPVPMPMAADNNAAPFLESQDLIDVTAASSGAVATDRPRFFLVMHVFDQDKEVARWELPAVWMAEHYRRVLAASLRPGIYHFERQDPGGDPRPVGPEFSVQDGKIIREILPEDLGFTLPDNSFAETVDGDPTLGSISTPTVVLHALPAGGEIDAKDASGDESSTGDGAAADDAHQSAGIDHDAAVDDAGVDDAAEVEETAAAGVAFFGAAGMLKGRWRRRFEAAEAVPAPRLHKVARLSRRIRRAAK